MFHKRSVPNSVVDITNGLVNYWPIKNDLKDYVGGADLVPGINGTNGFAADRFNIMNQAIYVSNSYYQLPKGIYFSGVFSIMGWVKPTRLLAHTYFMSFGNGQSSDNVYSGLADTGAGPYFGLWKGSSSILIMSSSTYLTLNTWQHLASTWDGTTATIYINGTSVKTTTASNQINNITRTQCYIGRSNWPTEPLAYAYYDDIRIYNRYYLISLDIISN